jgi:hypothetical protein
VIPASPIECGPMADFELEALHRLHQELDLVVAGDVLERKGDVDV